MLISTDQAVSLLKSDEIVAIPTETVYGLAAAIQSEVALKKIFSVKKRPFFDPLIVHVENSNQAKALTVEWPEIAQNLTEKFWPGPLTILLKKNDLISDLITSGLERVGLRCPQHPVALEILRKLKAPLAAPSANLFGRTSPTSAHHVEIEFAGQIPVVDGGSSNIGIESTVLLIDGHELAILRPGHILARDIEKSLNDRSIQFTWKSHVEKAESPGQLKHHYMPTKPLFWIEGQNHPDLLQELNQRIAELPTEIEGVQLNRPTQIIHFEELSLPPLAHEAARMLYSELRRLSDTKTDCLVFYKQDYMISPEWEPVLERLQKASSATIKT